MRVILAALCVATISGCVGESAPKQQGVGFETYADYQRRREEELMASERARRGVVAPAPTYAAPAPGLAPVAAGPASAVTSQPLSAMSTTPAAPAPVATAGAAAPVNNTGISDEQDFSAVAARESIESDKARIAANRQQYVQVEAAPLPQRSGGDGPSIVEYALAATNRVGQSMYKRSGVALASSARACGKFASPDLAQEEFLKRGGPKRDPKNLDPDGDGFACSWDPTPFQKARGG